MTEISVVEVTNDAGITVVEVTIPGPQGGSGGGGGGASAFTDLTDVPGDYIGDALKVVRVNAGETGLEFATASGVGDVVKVGTPVDNQVGVWTGDGTIEGDAALTFDTATDTLAVAASGKIAFGAVDVLSDSAGTTTLANIDALDPTTESTVEAAIDTLANLTSVQGRTVTLADAGADAFFGWDDSASAYENLTAAEAEAIIEPLIDTLANLTSVQGQTITLADAGADALFGWDDSASAYENLTQQEALDVLGLGSVVTLTPAGGNKTFQVSTTGNDTTGDGSVGLPWLTIQHAVNQVFRYDYENLYTATINVSDGTYNEGIGVRCLVQPYRYLYGNGISIIGNTSTPANVVVNGTGDVFDISAGAYTLRGMTITSTGTGGSVWASNGAEVSLGSLRFGNSPDHLVGSVRGSTVTFIGNITITATTSVGLFRLTEYGTLFCEGISITISNAWNVGTAGLSGFVRATQHSTLWFDSNTITGHANVTGRKYVFGTFSHYDGSTGSPDYEDPDDLPGDSAGLKDNTVTIGNFTNGWFSGYEKAGAPTSAELPDGCWGVFDNTSAGTPLVAYNDAGTIKYVELTAAPSGGSQTPWTSDIDADGFDLLFDDGTGISSSEAGNPELIKFTSAATAVNELTVSNAATGTAPTIAATGDNASVDLGLLSKGTSGSVIIQPGGTTITNTAVDGFNSVANINSNNQGLWTLSMAEYSADNVGVTVAAAKSRHATIGSHTTVQDGDVLFAIDGYGSDGTNFELAGVIHLEVDGTPVSAGDTTDMPGRWTFKTTLDGTDSATERLIIKNDGGIIVGVNGTSPGTGNISVASGKGIFDGAGNEQLLFTQTATAVNYVDITNAAIGNAPIIAPAGSDSNVNLGLRGKGTGGVVVSNPGGTPTGVTIDGFTAHLNIASNDDSIWGFQQSIFNNGSFGPSWIAAKSRNTTVGSHTVVQNGDGILHIHGFGSDGTDFEEAARIDFEVDGTPGNNDMPGRIIFSTTLDGASAPTLRMTIKNDGGLIVGATTTSPGAGGVRCTTIELGADTDTTLARSSAGNVSIEGNVIYRAGGTDVPITDGGTGASTAAGAVTNLGLDNTKIAALGVTLYGTSGSAIAAGTQADIYVPYACSITEWTILADQTGSIIIDVWADTYANYPPTVADSITGGTGFEVSGAIKAQGSADVDSPIVDIATIAAGTTLRFNVDSASTITRATLVLTVLKT